MHIKRMLWLYNHVSLMKSEVDIIRGLGYEVYIPKKPPFDVSIAVDWESDDKLTIPKGDIDRLNEVDFYEKPLAHDVMDIMNRYFDAVIFGPYIELVRSLVLNFKGILIFHPFGLENGMTYTQIFQDMGGEWLMPAVERLGKRFWFGEAYDNLHEIECDFFVNHAVHLPIGMSDTEIEDKWNGKKKRILFVCPRIKINPYYEQVYKEFKDNFKGFPYSIGGVQPISDPTDENILGYLPQDEYDTLYYDYTVMFYHSQEHHHVHYHPFEAVKKGLPLIFMAGGLLDYLGGRQLPGRSKTLAEARKKCKRILAGDTAFIEKVRESQKVLLEPMRHDFCKRKWKEAFAQIEQESFSKIQKDMNHVKRVAVIIPIGYTGGVLDYTIRILTALKTGIEKNHSKIELIFAYPEEDIYEEKDYFSKVRNLNIPIRKYKWEEFSNARLKTTLQLKGYSRKFIRDKYVLLNDGISYFGDCDYLLFTSDHVPGYVMSLKPYGVILHDYIQRYIPKLANRIAEQWFYNFARGAVRCYTTTDSTKQDGINYGGILEHRVELLPLFFEEIASCPEKENKKTKPESYFLWSTNTSLHKNHKMALIALKQYYRNGGMLKCYITGTNTEKFVSGSSGENDYINIIKQMIEEDKNLKRNIVIKGYLTKDEFVEMLKSARFLFHPGYADNGNGTAFDAAMLGVPSLSSDYPAMRNMDKKCGLQMLFFDGRNPEDIEKKLQYAEKYCMDLQKKLPSREELKKHTVQNEMLCEEMYRILLGCIGA